MNNTLHSWDKRRYAFSKPLKGIPPRWLSGSDVLDSWRRSETGAWILLTLREVRDKSGPYARTTYQLYHTIVEKAANFLDIRHSTASLVLFLKVTRCLRQLMGGFCGGCQPPQKKERTAVGGEKSKLTK